MTAHGMSEAGGLREGPTYCWADENGHQWDVRGVCNDSGLPLGYICRWCTREVTEIPRPATPDTDGANASAGEGLSEDDREALTGAVHYARTYWRFGNEPETQAALTTLAAAVDRLAGREAAAAKAAGERIERVETLCARWDAISAGETPTTAAIRKAIHG